MKYWKPDIDKYIAFMRNFTVYLESTSMNYPRAQFYKHLPYFLMSYSYCSTCAVIGRSGRNCQWP